MDNPRNAASGMQSREEREIASELAKWWWAWLVAGVLWIIAAIVILQFHHLSVALVGLAVGIMLIVAGIQELAVGTLTRSGGWRWLWISFGVLLLITGIFAVFNPVGTFIALADALGFIFALIGIVWIVEAFATANSNPLWWLGLISGFLMVGLGFWTGGQFFATQAYTLLIFAGIWALFHGISDIVRAFAIRNLETTMALA